MAVAGRRVVLGGRVGALATALFVYGSARSSGSGFCRPSSDRSAPRRSWSANNSVIGSDYHRPKVGLPGTAGLADLGSLDKKLYYWVPSHSPRSLVARVDFVSAAGYLGGGDERARLGIRNGPEAVISNLAVMDFQPESKRMRLRSLHPGVTLEQVRQSTGFELLLPDHPVPQTPVPSVEQVRLIRDGSTPTTCASGNSVRGDLRFHVPRGARPPRCRDNERRSRRGPYRPRTAAAQIPPPRLDAPGPPAHTNLRVPAAHLPALTGRDAPDRLPHRAALARPCHGARRRAGTGERKTAG